MAKVYPWTNCKTIEDIRIEYNKELDQLNKDYRLSLLNLESKRTESVKYLKDTCKHEDENGKLLLGKTVLDHCLECTLCHTYIDIGSELAQKFFKQDLE